MNQVDAQLFYWGLGIPDMGAVASQIFLQCVYFWPIYVYSSIVRAPSHNQYGKCSWYFWCIWIIYMYGRYLDVQTIAQLLYFMLFQPSLFPNATFWMKHMTCWPKCKNGCVLETSMWYLRRIVTLGPPPMGMGWKTGLYCGAPYWFYNQTRRHYDVSYNLAVIKVVDYSMLLLLFISITKFNQRIWCENVISIKISLGK